MAVTKDTPVDDPEYVEACKEWFKAAGVKYGDLVKCITEVQGWAGVWVSPDATDWRGPGMRVGQVFRVCRPSACTNLSHSACCSHEPYGALCGDSYHWPFWCVVKVENDDEHEGI